MASGRDSAAHVPNLRALVLQNLSQLGTFSETLAEQPRLAAPALSEEAVQEVPSAGGELTRVPDTTIDASPETQLRQVDQLFDPEILQAQGELASPGRQTLLQSIFPALAEAVSIGFSRDPGQALQRSLREQTRRQELEVERRNQLRSRLSALRFQKGQAKLRITETIRHEQTQEQREVREWLRERTGQADIANLKFRQKLFVTRLEEDERNKRARENRDFQLQLQEFAQGDKRKAEMITKWFELGSLTGDMDQSLGVVNRLFKPEEFGKPTDADAKFLRRASLIQQGRKERLAGRGPLTPDDLARQLTSVFRSALGANDFIPLTRDVEMLDPTDPAGKRRVKRIDPNTNQPMQEIVTDPLTGRPALRPATDKERTISALKTALLFVSFRNAALKGEEVPDSIKQLIDNPFDKAQQTIDEAGRNDPDQLNRARAASFIDQMKAEGFSTEEILTQIEDGDFPPVLKGAMRLRLEQLRIEEAQ